MHDLVQTIATKPRIISGYFSTPHDNIRLETKSIIDVVFFTHACVEPLFKSRGLVSSGVSGYVKALGLALADESLYFCPCHWHLQPVFELERRHNQCFFALYSMNCK